MPRRVQLLCYGVVGSYFGLRADDVLYTLRGAPDAEEVVVRIHSDGGDAMEGICINTLLRSHPGRKVVQIDGLAASAASIIAMAGDEITMVEGSMMMLHNAWTIAIGDAADLRSQAETADKISAAYAAEYARKTGRPASEVQALMSRNNWSVGTWFTAQEALAEKLADRVGPPVQLQARAQSARVASAPLALLTLAQGARRSESMNKDEARALLRAKAAADPEIAAALAELEPDGDEGKKPSAELEKERAARVRAEAQLEQKTYEDLLHKALADGGNEHARKIPGPAAEAKVRANYKTVAELERYLATVEPAQALRPERASVGGAEITATDRKVMARIEQKHGLKLDEGGWAQQKAERKEGVR